MEGPESGVPNWVSNQSPFGPPMRRFHWLMNKVVWANGLAEQSQAGNLNNGGAESGRCHVAAEVEGCLTEPYW